MRVKRASPVAAKRRKVCRMGRKGDSFWYNGGGFRVQGSGFRVSSWGVLSLDYMRKRFSGFNRFSGFKGGGTAHKKIEAPRSIDGGDARRQYLSHQSLAAPNP